MSNQTLIHNFGTADPVHETEVALKEGFAFISFHFSF